MASSDSAGSGSDTDADASDDTDADASDDTDAESDGGSDPYTFCDGALGLMVEPSSGDAALTVGVVDASGDLLYRDDFGYGFWDDRNARGQIKNSLAEEAPFSATKLQTELSVVWDMLREDEDTVERDTRSDDVDRLIENTHAVEIHGGDNTEWIVSVEGIPAASNRGEDDRAVRQLTFAADEFGPVEDEAPPVVGKYHAVFYERLDLTPEEWNRSVLPEWEDQQREVGTFTTTAERVAQSVVRQIAGKATAHADREALVNSTEQWHLWFDPDPTPADVEGPVLWAESDTLLAALEAHNKDVEYLGDLSTALRNEAYTVRERWQTKIAGQPVSLYPFLPEVLQVEDPELDVVGYGDEDAGDQEPGQDPAQDAGGVDPDEEGVPEP